MLFEATDTSGKVNLWVYSGATSTITELLPSNSYFYGLLDNVAPDFALAGSDVVFNGIDASGNQGLWVTNGTSAGTYELNVPAIESTSIAAISVIGSFTVAAPPPIVTLAASPAAANGTTATLGTAKAGTGSDALSVALTSDADFATGSKLVLTNGSLVYTPGLITTAKAGTDTLKYSVIDTVNGAVTTETQTVTLTPPKAPAVTLAAKISRGLQHRNRHPGHRDARIWQRCAVGDADLRRGFRHRQQAGADQREPGLHARAGHRREGRHRHAEIYRHRHGDRRGNSRNPDRDAEQRSRPERHPGEGAGGLEHRNCHPGHRDGRLWQRCDVGDADLGRRFRHRQ